MGLLGSDTMLGRKWEIQGTGNDPRIIEVTHPASPKWAGYDDIYRNFEVIYTQLA
jgi:hypothetical protein